MMERKFNPGKALLIILLAAAAVTLLGFVIMNLWNSILTGVLGVKTITFWQAIGIFILSKILFGFGSGKGPGGGGFWWRKKMQRKMQHMSPEEREKFREEMYRRMNFWHMDPEDCRPFFKRNVNKNSPDESN